MGFRGLWICWRVKIRSQRAMLDGLGNVLHIHRAFNESLQALRHAEQITRIIAWISPWISTRISSWISSWISTVWARTKMDRKAKNDRLTGAGARHSGETEERFEELVKGVRAMLRSK